MQELFQSYPTMNTTPLNLDWILTKIAELEATVAANVIQNSILEEYEKSVNITQNRKLSLLGNFTGKWEGKTLAELLAAISQNNALYLRVIQALEDGLPIERVTTGGFFSDGENEQIENGGIF